MCRDSITYACSALCQLFPEIWLVFVKVFRVCLSNHIVLTCGVGKHVVVRRFSSWGNVFTYVKKDDDSYIKTGYQIRLRQFFATIYPSIFISDTTKKVRGHYTNENHHQHEQFSLNLKKNLSYKSDWCNRIGEWVLFYSLHSCSSGIHVCYQK